MGAIAKFVAKSSHVVKKNAPTILTVAGVAGLVTSGVLAAKRAYRHQEVINDKARTAKVISQEIATHQTNGSPAEKLGALIGAYAHPAKEFVKAYGLPITVASASVASILWGHGMLKQRNAALIAAYASLERSFAAYRKRVVKDGGAERDAYYANGLSQIEDPDDPSAIAVTREEKASHLYTRLFDENNPNWGPEGKDYNLYFLKVQQNRMNDRLQSRGHLFLNEVLDDLGFDHTSEGAIVGWIFDSEEGDGYVDFGLDKINHHHSSFMKYLDGDIPIEFNVDGVIYDKI